MADEVKITVRDFIENIRKNGLRKTQHYLFQKKPNPNSYYERRFSNVAELEPGDKIGMACAFGQGLINIGAHYPQADMMEDEVQMDSLEYRLFTDTYELNDETGLSFADIADSLWLRYESELDSVLTFPAFDWTPYL